MSFPGRSGRLRRTAPWVFLLALLAPVRAGAQTPVPSPLPERLQQDELDLQARASVVQGSGARAFGMGGAFLARADDATAASWNPAGLSYLRRPEVSLVWGAVNEIDSQMHNPDGSLNTDDRRSGSAPDFLAVTYPFELRSVTGAAQLSFQRVISFASHRTITKIEQNIRNVDSSGGFDVLSLGSGWQLWRKLRLGITLNRWLNGFDQTVERQQRRRTQQNAKFDLSGWNLNVGAILAPFESLNLGAVAKTSFKGAATLDRTRMDFFSQQDAPDVVTQNSYARNDLVLEFPGAVGVGASWRLLSPLTLSLDYTRTFWRNGRIHNYFTLPPTPEKGGPPPIPSPPDDLFDVLPYPTLNEPRQHDTEQTRAGVEYVLIFDRVKVPLRAGYFSDRQYLRDVDGRAPRFDGWTAGTGLIVGPMLLDVAYTFESGSYLDADENQISVTAHRLYVSLIYRPGGSR